MTTRLTTWRWAELDERARTDALLRPALRAAPEIDARVAEIIARVRAGGDRALLDLTAELDGVRLDSLRVDAAEFDAAEAELPPGAAEAIDVAIANVGTFHRAQLTAPVRVETAPGVICERITRPIAAVGLYVPAGSAPLPSTAIMLAVPAGLAECPVRVICTPPRPDGRADPAVIAVARRCGIEHIFKIGGAQAVAALAYGTESVPKTDKVFGPGNAWVTAAKCAVANDPEGAALDMPAGPSEVLIIADANADPRFVALDLMSQAEHGPDSQAILVCTTASLAEAVEAEINALLPALGRRTTIEASLEHAAAFVVADIDEAVALANRYAPEHLIIQVINARQYLEKIKNAGSIFLGAWTPESVGDYCSGTNHVLPTYGYARTCSGLSVGAFQKTLTVQELTRDGLAGLAPTVQSLATLEGLDAHANAVSVRLADIAQRKRA